MVKIECTGKIEVALLKRIPNEFRDKRVVRELKRLFPEFNHYNRSWLLTAFDLWMMQGQNTGESLRATFEMELNDNGTK